MTHRLAAVCERVEADMSSLAEEQVLVREAVDELRTTTPAGPADPAAARTETVEEEQRAERIARVELDPVEELRVVRMQVAAREAKWDAAMSEQRARLDQLDLEVRGKSEIVTRMAERMPSMETLETSIANLVNVCEADLEKTARGVSDMQILLDNQSEVVDKHAKILTAVEANVKRIQSQVFQLQKQLGTAISTFESQASVMSEQGTPLRPVSPRS